MGASADHVCWWEIYLKRALRVSFRVDFELVLGTAAAADRRPCKAVEAMKGFLTARE
jgi:hypothetical protein